MTDLRDPTDDIIRGVVHELVATAPDPKPLADGFERPIRSTRWLAAAAAMLLVGGAVVAAILMARDDDPGAIVSEPDPSTTFNDVLAVENTDDRALDPNASVPSTSPSTTVPRSTAPIVEDVPIYPVPGTVSPPSTSPVLGAVDWRDLPREGSGIADSCIRASLICTRVIHDGEGTPISYDPDTRVLTRHGVPEVTTTLPDSYGLHPWLYHAGPDEVVYLQVDPAVPGELAADIVALTLSDGDAGREIGRWGDVVDAVGDSELVATRDGLVNVDCCGPDPVRPPVDAEVLVPWLDRDGDVTTTSTPTVRATVGFPDVTISRTDGVSAGTRDWTFRPPEDWIGRGMPQIEATFDGGFIAALPAGRGVTIVRGWTSGHLEQISLASLPAVALDRNGRALIGDGDLMWRVEPFVDRTLRPSGRAEVDFEAGTVTLPDFSALDAPWLIDPVAFADAVAGLPDVNEIRSITAEQQAESDWLVTVTTSNLFDDSGFAVRWQLVLERGVDGRFAFVSGTWSQACQPGRGHQDFSSELCT